VRKISLFLSNRAGNAEHYFSRDGTNGAKIYLKYYFQNYAKAFPQNTKDNFFG
jgi:hypothetical protein